MCVHNFNESRFSIGTIQAKCVIVNTKANSQFQANPTVKSGLPCWKQFAQIDQQSTLSLFLKVSRRAKWNYYVKVRDCF